MGVSQARCQQDARCVQPVDPVVGGNNLAFIDSGTYWTLVLPGGCRDARQSPEGDEPPSRGYALDLVLEHQQRRPQQVLVRGLGRYPSLELHPAAALDADTVARAGGEARVGSTRSHAPAMRVNEAAEVGVDADH